MFYNDNEMDKVASSLAQDGYELGMELYGIMKAAAAGDPNAILFVDGALKLAEDAEAVEQATGTPVSPSDVAAAQDDAGAEQAIAQQGPTIQCPQCGNVVTPTPDGHCPVCGFDFNQLADTVNDDGASPEAQAPAPAPEEVAEAAEGIKQAAIEDPRVYEYLRNNYGHLI